MAALDPWSYAEKTKSEYAEQVALFMWANMAANYGLNAAIDPESYSVAGHAAAYGTWRNDVFPVLHRLFAIKNAEKGGAIRGGVAKAEGVKSGVPDVMLPVPRTPNGVFLYCGLFIELKRLASDRGRKGIVSAEQAGWQVYLNGVGYLTKVCYGWLEARDAIVAYLT